MIAIIIIVFALCAVNVVAAGMQIGKFRKGLEDDKAGDQ